MGLALNIVRKRFPEVTKVVDAKSALVLSVTEEDNANSKTKKHTECALAVACKRQANVQGAMISMKTAYLIKGKTAFRYNVPPYAAREIVSFDRKAGFTPGEYELKPPPPTARLGRRAERNGTHDSKDKTVTGNLIKRFRTTHKIQNVRAKLS